MEIVGSSPKGLALGRTDQGWLVVRLHYSANPLFDPDTPAGRARIADLKKGYISEAHWNMEMEINPYALQGQLVYPEFQRHLHVLPLDEIIWLDKERKHKRRGCCFMAIDPHPRTPHAALWVMIDRWNDWYVYRDFWDSKVYGIPKAIKDEDTENIWTVRDYAWAIARLEGNDIAWFNPETDREYGVYKDQPGGERIIERRVDQAGKGFFETGSASSIWETYKKYGLFLREPYKVHEAGENAIRELLKPRRHNERGMWPRLHIADDCRELILELERYRYKKTRRYSDDKELYQVGVEARCHLIDCLRYLATANLFHSIRQEGTIYYARA